MKIILTKYKLSFIFVSGMVVGATLLFFIQFCLHNLNQPSKVSHGQDETLIYLYPGNTSLPFLGLGINRKIQFRMEDVELIKNKLNQIDRLSPVLIAQDIQFRSNNNADVQTVFGVAADFCRIQNILPLNTGRFISELDEKQSRRVVFLGNILANTLFENKNPIGEYIELDNFKFLVIGVMTPEIEKYDDGTSNQSSKAAFIPAATFSTFFRTPSVDHFLFQASHKTSPNLIVEKLKQILANKYRFDPSDKKALEFYSKSLKN